MTDKPRFVARVLSCPRCPNAGYDKDCHYCHGTDRIEMRVPVKPQHWSMDRWTDYLDVTR